MQKVYACSLDMPCGACRHLPASSHATHHLDGQLVDSRPGAQQIGASWKNSVCHSNGQGLDPRLRRCRWRLQRRRRRRSVRRHGASSSSHNPVVRCSSPAFIVCTSYEMQTHKNSCPQIRVRIAEAPIVADRGARVEGSQAASGSSLGCC